MRIKRSEIIHLLFYELQDWLLQFFKIFKNQTSSENFSTRQLQILERSKS